MDEIDKRVSAQFIEDLKTQFKSWGLSEEEFYKQMTNLGALISTSAVERLLKEKPPENKLTPEEVPDYISRNFTELEIQRFTQEEAKRITRGYLEMMMN